MLNNNQDQKVEQHAVAVQTQGNVDIKITNEGIDINQIRVLCSDLFELNFYRMKGAAEDIARQRAQEVTEKFLLKLETENPKGLRQAEQPDFQDALFTVQKEYAKAGDQELGDLLVDLLVDRSKHENRNLLQIVLNESLRTAPKLTSDQLSILALVFFFRHTRRPLTGSHNHLKEYLTKHIQHFSIPLGKSNSSFHHLDFTGCGSVSMGEIQLEDIFLQSYLGLFKLGLDPAVVDGLQLNPEDRQRYFVPCLNDLGKLQVNAIDRLSLDSIFDTNKTDPESRKKIISMFDLGTMQHDQVRGKVVELCPFMQPVFDAWTESKLKNFELTSVGMAIGHSNIKRISGEFADLSFWIN